MNSMIVLIQHAEGKLLHAGICACTRVVFDHDPRKCPFLRVYCGTVKMKTVVCRDRSGAQYVLTEAITALHQAASRLQSLKYLHLHHSPVHSGQLIALASYLLALSSSISHLAGWHLTSVRKKDNTTGLMIFLGTILQWQGAKYSSDPSPSAQVLKVFIFGIGHCWLKAGTRT